MDWPSNVQIVRYSDSHGQLFLSNTKIRNFTSCYKDPAFLDFFYTRLRPFSASSAKNETDRHEAEDLLRKGYTFVSPCGIERNYVRPEETPIVFQALKAAHDSEGWLLRYAGTLETHFEPSSLLVDQRGYLYHPSPSSPTLGSGRRKRPSDATEASNRYGPYSLLRSQLVIDRLSEALDVDDTTGEGEYRFEGKWYSIGSLKEGHLKLGQQVREH